MWNDIAIPAFVPKTLNDVVCAYHMALIRTNQSKLRGEYLHRIFEAGGVRDQLHYHANGVTRYAINLHRLENALIPVPPINEQYEIAQYINDKLALIGSMNGEISKEIQRVKEYRTALISAAVTGKIDVRGLA